MSTHVAMCGTMTSIGDIIAQGFFNKGEPWDFMRTAKFGAVGAFYVGPILTGWFKFLDKRLGAGFSIRKLATDQGLMNPSLTSGFIGINAMLNGVDFKSAVTLVSGEIVDVMMHGWPYWITIQFLNFKFVPLAYRVFIIQTAAVFWNTFLAWKAAAANAKIASMEVPKLD